MRAVEGDNVKCRHHRCILHTVHTLDGILGAYIEQIRAGSTPYWYTMWFGTSNRYLRSMKLLTGQKWEKPFHNSILEGEASGNIYHLLNLEPKQSGSFIYIYIHTYIYICMYIYDLFRCISHRLR